MKHLVEFFIDGLQARDNRLAGLDPRIPLVAAFATITCIVLASHALFPLLVALACMAGARAAGGRFRFARLASPLGFALVLGAVQLFVHGGTPLFRFAIFNHWLTITRQGADAGLLLGSRVLGAASVMVLLTALVPVHGIFVALRWLGAPAGWVEVALLTYRYSFVLAEIASTMSDAQRLRLGHKGIGRGIGNAATLTGAVLLRSMDQAVTTHQAMLLRGYRGQMPMAPRARLGRAMATALFFAVLLPVSGLIFVEWAGALV
jgi:cobalt ECF transporter T component CbiQ